MCDRIKCSLLIDTFDAFEVALSNGIEFDDIYKKGDIHFTTLGNSILANELIKSYKKIIK